MPLIPMDKNVDPDVCSKRFALRLATMIAVRLLWYKHYIPWVDQLIAKLDDLPNWLLEIATIKYYPDAVAAINGFVNCEPFESFDSKRCADEIVACLFLRYQSGAISWATFLNDAGSFADVNEGRHDCEYFYAFLNELEDNEYGHKLEIRQRNAIASEFPVAINTIRPLYARFQEHFRHYIANEA